MVAGQDRLKVQRFCRLNESLQARHVGNPGYRKSDFQFWCLQVRRENSERPRVMTKPQASINPVWVTKQRAVNNPAAGHHGPIRVDRRRCVRVGVVPDRRFPLEGKPAGFGVFFIGINGHGRPRQQSMSREGKFGGAIGLVHQPPPQELNGQCPLVQYLAIFVGFGRFHQSVEKYAINDDLPSRCGGWFGGRGRRLGCGCWARTGCGIWGRCWGWGRRRRDDLPRTRCVQN